MNLSTYATIPDAARRDAAHWHEILAPALSIKTGIVATLRNLSQRTGHPYTTLRRKYYALKKGDASALIDRRLIPANTTRDLISSADIETLRRYVESNQRKNLPAIRAMRRDWIKGNITTDTPLDTTTGYPKGWSPRNLARFIPDRHTLTASRIGRTAAASERRLIYTTRAQLHIGSHYLFDDIWHDHFVNVLDQRKTGRPLEFHALDLYSACKFTYGMTVRLENDGRMESLKEADMRFLLADTLFNHGYSPRGTILVVEHGTAAIRPDLEAMLHDETHGLVTVARSGMEGAAAAAHQYAGRSKGNFRFKAALESLGNLIHNEMATLPGQTGKDRDHRPEQLHGLLKHNDALLQALAQLPPERAAMLRWPLLTIQQFRAIAAEIYTRINTRTTHDLEGWDLHYTPDTRTGLMRRLSPAEVWNTGRRNLIRLTPQATATLLLKDNGTELTVRRGMLTLTDSQISGDPLLFDAHHLTDREKILAVINPYAPDTLWAFDARARFIATCPRIHRISRADTEALQHECGRAAKIEAQRLAPFRARHAAAARQRAADARHNTALLTQPTQRPSRLPQDPEALTAATTPPYDPSPAHAGSCPSSPSAPEDTDDLAAQIQSLI